MRKRKPHGNHKPHSADECGICAKPRGYRERKRTQEAEAAEYQDGDLEKFFGIDPDFTGDMSTDEYIDRVRG